MSEATLAGVRVVTLAVYVPVPVAAQRLTAMGADVTAVEPPLGDPMAVWCPAWYAQLHAGQRVCRLDIKDAHGRAAFDALLDDADLLLTSVRRPALRRLGLDWERLHLRYPRLSHVALVGWASSDDDRPGHDLTFQSAAGLVSPPALPVTLFADLAGAEQVVSAGLALLLARARGGDAGRSTVSLEGALSSFAAPLRHGLTAAGAMLGGGLAGYGVYRTSDGWIAVAAMEPHFWSALTMALGVHAASDRTPLEARFASDTAAHWEQWAAARGLPIVALNHTMEDE